LEVSRNPGISADEFVHVSFIGADAHHHEGAYVE
jgi:hypothetical protein